MPRKLIRHGIALKRTIGGWAGQVHGYKFRASRTRARCWEIRVMDPDFPVFGKTLGDCVAAFVHYIEKEVNRDDQDTME